MCTYRICIKYHFSSMKIIKFQLFSALLNRQVFQLIMDIEKCSIYKKEDKFLYIALFLCSTTSIKTFEKQVTKISSTRKSHLIFR